jgi:uncharacterized membrane protein
MNWKRFYSVRSYIRTSLWIVPFIAIPLELVATRLLHRLDGWLGWRLLDVAETGAQAMLNAVVTATLSFVVFTFGSLLVALQVASGQLTPRIIATVLVRNNVVRYTTGLFIFTLLFAISAQNRMQGNVFQLVVFVAACLGILCFAAFLFLIDYAARLLRPISIVSLVGKAGLAVIESVYPEPSLGPNKPASRPSKLGTPDRTVRHQGTSEIVLAVNIDELVAEAHKSGGVVEFVPQVGDFVATDEPLFNLYGNAASLDDERLRSIVAFGPERTMEQDPTFAFRIVIDIALKALSPAINDPTTAVIAIDQLHRLLRKAGNQNLRTDEILEKSGKIAGDFPDAELGRLCASRIHRNTPMRRAKHANCPAFASDDRESDTDFAKAPPFCATKGIAVARSRRRKIFSLPGRSCPCADWRSSGFGRGFRARKDAVTI